MQIILIGTESLLEMPCVRAMAFCCLFPSVFPYYQWLALQFFCVADDLFQRHC